MECDWETGCAPVPRGVVGHDKDRRSESRRGSVDRQYPDPFRSIAYDDLLFGEVPTAFASFQIEAQTKLLGGSTAAT
jgi:hypothetical protein